MSITMVGMFDTESQARDAMQRLQAEGIPRDMMQLSDESSDPRAALDADVGGTGAPEPERGPISRFFHNLFGGDDETYAAHYSEASRRGHGVLSVTVADESQVDHISRLLDECGAVDIDERVAQWTAGGYVPPPAGAGATKTVAGTGAESPMQTLKEVEEQLIVGKRTVGKGGVRVIQRTMQRPVEEQVTLRDEQAIVDRQLTDRPATDADLRDAFKDREIEMRESREEAVVSKDARVVGEVQLGENVVDRTETIRDEVRGSRVDVEPIDIGRGGGGGGGGGSAVPSDYAVPVGESRYSGPDRRVTFKDAYAGPERRRAASSRPTAPL